MIIKNPLRYPGSKSKATVYIDKFIEFNKINNDSVLIEPYAGSCSASFSAITKKLVRSAVLIEQDPLIFAFWHCVFNDTSNLVQKINELDVSLDTWYEFQKYRNARCMEYSVLKMAVAGLFYNRTNFSGILNANPLGGLEQKSEYKINCRFNKEAVIKSIINLAKLRNSVTMIHDDAVSHLIQNENRYLCKNSHHILYIDPPYYEKGKQLYRYWYEDEDHENLANFLFGLNNYHFSWLTSYDDCQFIRELYAGCQRQEVYFDYSVTSRKKVKELFISNKELPPVEQTADNKAVITA